MLQSTVGIVQTFGIVLRDAAGVPRVIRGRGVRCYRVRTAAGTVLGDLYGLILASAPSPHLVIDRDTIIVAEPVADTDAFETRVLDEIRGTFAVVTHTGLPRRLYPDCGSSLPIVYCAASRRAASSAGMLLDSGQYAARFLTARHTRLIANGPIESWIPGTLTAHADVARLLPNHYLDLETWRATRFWPRPDFKMDLAPEAAERIVADRMRDFVCAAATEFRVGMALTAGYDSRMLVAAARPVVERIGYFTIAPPRAGLDQIMAGEIARDLGLAHRLVPVHEATADERAIWDHAVGHTLAHMNRAVHPTLRRLDFDLILTGILGETGRARLYRHDAASINARRPTAALVLTRMGQPLDADLLVDIEAWLAAIAWLPTSVILDLAVLELFYVPLWRPAQCAEISEMMPFVDRKVQAAFLAVAPEQKAGDKLFRAIIARLWPEALRLPINQFGDYRDKLDLLGKVLRPGRLGGFLRRRRNA